MTDHCSPCRHIIDDTSKCANEYKCPNGQYDMDGVCVREKDLKCAPNKKFVDGSCISLNVLMEMINAYNKQYPNQIIIVPEYEKFRTLNPSKYKKYYVCKLNQVLKNKDQTQWVKFDFVNKMKESARKDLIENTFVPDGPKGKFEWLNTTHIEESLKQYENKHKDFTFLGAVPIDFDDLPQLGIKNLDFDKLMSQGKTKIGIIFNLDEHYKSGSHWVALFADLKKGQVYFFDSYGIEPEARIRKLMRRISKYYTDKLGHPINKLDVRHNKTQHQKQNSECGVYSMSFILRLLDGESFDDIEKNIVKDDDINTCRKVYFK